jgi:hypothetical protein
MTADLAVQAAKLLIRPTGGVEDDQVATMPKLLACGSLNQAGTSPESLMDPALTECHTKSRFHNGPKDTHRDEGFPVLKQWRT